MYLDGCIHPTIKLTCFRLEDWQIHEANERERCAIVAVLMRCVLLLKIPIFSKSKRFLSGFRGIKVILGFRTPLLHAPCRAVVFIHHAYRSSKEAVHSAQDHGHFSVS